MNIGIAATAISGIGVTTKMPPTVFAVKIAENKFKVARTAAEALQTVPKVLDLTAVGVGYSSATGGDIELRLTPPANTAITTKVFQYNFNETGTGGVGFVTFTDSRLKSVES